MGNKEKLEQLNVKQTYRFMTFCTLGTGYTVDELEVFK